MKHTKNDWAKCGAVDRRRTEEKTVNVKEEENSSKKFIEDLLSKYGRMKQSGRM